MRWFAEEIDPSSTYFYVVIEDKITFASSFIIAL
jgi:hypothetical protein